MVFSASFLLSPFTFVLLLVCFSTSGSRDAYAAEGTRLSNHIELFNPGVQEVPFSPEETACSQKDVYPFRGHSLVGVNGVLVALAGVQYNRSFDSDEGIWARYVEPGGQWSPSATLGNKQKWKTTIATHKAGKRDHSITMTGPKAVVKGNKIFTLAKPATSTWCQGPVPSPRGSQEPATVPGVRLKALGVGRQVWGSAVFGRPGTKRRLELLHSYTSLRVAPSLALRIHFWKLLQLCGDVELNPGPILQGTQLKFRWAHAGETDPVGEVAERGACCVVCFYYPSPDVIASSTPLVLAG